MIMVVAVMMMMMVLMLILILIDCGFFLAIVTVPTVSNSRLL